MSLPRFVGLKSIYNNKYLQCLKEDVEEVHGFNQISAENPVSPYAKYEIELAKTCDGLVHIRSCYNNKYLVRWSPRHWWIVAAADEPDEDKSYWSCTLFEPLFVRNKNIRLRHVQRDHYACLWRLGSESNKDCCLFAGSESTDKDACDVFTIIDWEVEIDLQPARNPSLHGLIALDEKHILNYQNLKADFLRVKKEVDDKTVALGKTVAKLEKAKKGLEEISSSLKQKAEAAEATLEKEVEGWVYFETALQSKQDAKDVLEAKHMAELEEANDEGYNEALEESVEKFKPIQHQLYQAGYELGLQEAGVLANSPLRVEVKVPKDFFKAKSTGLEEEVSAEEESSADEEGVIVEKDEVLLDAAVAT